jgi:hypothetical protein
MLPIIQKLTFSLTMKQCKKVEIFLTEKSEKLEKFKKYVTMNYDVNNENHEKLLSLLWEYSTNGEVLESRISNQWKTIGFQGKDPATDFRGVGVFGLYNLIYFAKYYPKKYSEMLKQTKKKAHLSYPFAIAGFNVTMMVFLQFIYVKLFDILGFGFQSKSNNSEAKKNFIELITQNMKKYDQSVWFKEFSEEKEEKKQKEDLLLDFDDFVSTKSPRKEEEKEDKKKKKKKKKSSIFEEIYVASFIILDEEWYALNATYFSFPKVLENTRKRVEELLENRFESFEDVVNYIKKK